MTHIWRLEGYGIGLESTRGTAVDPTFWVHQTEADFDDVFEKVQDESALGVNMNTSESVKTKQYANWNIGGILAANSIWIFLKSLLGSVTSAETAGTGAYSHAFSTDNVNSKPSYTISKKTPIGGLRYALGVTESLGISANVGEAVIMSAGTRAKAGASASLTKSYTADNKFYWKHVTIKLADTVAGLDGASAVCIENFELNITQELEDGFCFGSGVDLSDIFNKGFSIDGSITKKKTDETYKDYVKNETYKAMRIEIIDTDTTIGVSDNPTIKIDIARVSFEEHAQDGGLNDIVRENITLKWHYDLANSADLDITVINETASY